MRLVRILDLNGLSKPYKWAKETRRSEFAEFSRFPDVHDPVRAGNWMDRQLTSRSAGGRRDFVALTLRVLGEYRSAHPYQPTWAAAWQQLRPFLAEPPERWLQAVGVARPWGGRWLIPLVYTMREAGTVARPTQLDAGWDACHFPSPPESEVSIDVAAGGAPMDLNGAPGSSLLAEYVHKQMDHPIRHWEDAGSRLERTAAPVVGPTAPQRVTHHHKLRRRYGSGVANWMPSPI